MNEDEDVNMSNGHCESGSLEAKANEMVKLNFEAKLQVTLAEFSFATAWEVVFPSSGNLTNSETKVMD